MNPTQEADFEKFVAGAGHRLQRTAFLLTGDRQHAEDLVQTALERTARKWHRLEGAPEAYARAVLANAATDRWRSQRARVHEVSAEETTGEPTADNTGDIAGGVVLRRSLIQGLLQLTAHQRALLVLRLFDDLTEADTARTLGISIGSVKSGTSRALDRLRTFVPDDLVQEAHR